jgi:hypothetical protein
VQVPPPPPQISCNRQGKKSAYAQHTVMKIVKLGRKPFQESYTIFYIRFCYEPVSRISTPGAFIAYSYFYFVERSQYFASVEIPYRESRKPVIILVPFSLIPSCIQGKRVNSLSQLAKRSTRLLRIFHLIIILNTCSVFYLSRWPQSPDWRRGVCRDPQWWKYRHPSYARPCRVLQLVHILIGRIGTSRDPQWWKYRQPSYARPCRVLQLVHILIGRLGASQDPQWWKYRRPSYGRPCHVLY